MILRQTSTLIAAGIDILMSKSFMMKVHKGTINQQNEENTLLYLQRQARIPETTNVVEVNSKTLDAHALKTLPASTQAVLLKLNNNCYYYGLIRSGQATDPSAIFIFHDGTYYEGEMLDGKFEGRGCLRQASQDFKEVIFEYVGEWRGGRPEGKGRQVITNSMTYEGTFRAGRKNGPGKMTYRDGTVYEGEFKDNAIEGKGKYTTKAHEWQGKWQEGYLEGQGKQTSFGQEDPQGDEDDPIASQSVYRGGFKRGQKDGMGTYTWGNDFSEYTGHFSNGQLDGEGRLKIGQTQYIGEWKKGVEVRLNAATASKIQFKKVNKRSNEETQ